MPAPASALPRPASRPLTFIRHRPPPRKVQWAKLQKGFIPIPTGGSTMGTTLAFGDFGIRIKCNGARFTGKQLETVQELIKRKLNVIKGAKSISVPFQIFQSALRATKPAWARERAPHL